MKLTSLAERLKVDRLRPNSAGRLMLPALTRYSIAVNLAIAAQAHLAYSVHCGRLQVLAETGDYIPIKKLEGHVQGAAFTEQFIVVYSFHARSVLHVTWHQRLC